jgi:hypothetical protein
MKVGLNSLSHVGEGFEQQAESLIGGNTTHDKDVIGFFLVTTPELQKLLDLMKWRHNRNSARRHAELDEFRLIELGIGHRRCIGKPDELWEHLARVFGGHPEISRVRGITPKEVARRDVMVFEHEALRESREPHYIRLVDTVMVNNQVISSQPRRTRKDWQTRGIHRDRNKDVNVDVIALEFSIHPEEIIADGIAGKMQL